MLYIALLLFMELFNKQTFVRSNLVASSGTSISEKTGDSIQEVNAASNIPKKNLPIGMAQSV